MTLNYRKRFNLVKEFLISIRGSYAKIILYHALQYIIIYEYSIHTDCHYYLQV